MKKMTYAQFEDRVRAVSEARKIFSNLTDNNISKSFEAYQLILAERRREIILVTLVHGDRPQTLLDDEVHFERPKCPDCGSAMMIRPLNQNDEGVKTQLVCGNKDCKLVLDSELTVDQWIVELEKHGPNETKTKDQA